MDNDDRLVGRILSRREFLTLMAAAGGGILAACTGLESQSTPTQANRLVVSPPIPATQVIMATESANMPVCVVRPEMTEGPYFLDDQLDRSDIRVEPSNGSIVEGMPLVLTFNVTQVGSDGCAPLAGAVVDIWHCDAQGVYSGFTDQAEGFVTEGMQFLRGYQVTDENGTVQFTTIYPGWYTGRAVHIHFKIRTEAATASGYEFTSQLFLDDDLTDQVHAQAPYAVKGQRDRRNADDGIYQNGGDQLLLDATSENGGYKAVFNIGLDLSNA